MSAFVKVLQYTKKKLHLMKCVYFKLQFRSCITSEPGKEVFTFSPVSH